MSRSELHLEAAIDLDAVRALPRYTVSNGKLGSAGMGCAGDPPGYPTYYVQPVYNMQGNNFERGPQAVLSLDGVRYVAQHSDDWRVGANPYATRMRGLYKPLPLEHPRVLAWIGDTFRHHHHHYLHPTELEHGRRKSVFFPFTLADGMMHHGMQAPKPARTFKDNPSLSDAWRTVEQAAIRLHNEALAIENTAIERANAEIREAVGWLCTPDNHFGVIRVREYYPDAPIELLLPYIDHPPKVTATWFETLADKPTPETCPGSDSLQKRHPVNGSWCQVCGWAGEK